MLDSLINSVSIYPSVKISKFLVIEPSELIRSLKIFKSV